MPPGSEINGTDLFRYQGAEKNAEIDRNPPGGLALLWVISRPESRSRAMVTSITPSVRFDFPQIHAHSSHNSRLLWFWDR